jgi:hypothetical protein
MRRQPHGRGQREGRYRTDLDPAVKAAEIVAFITGLETSWLLDPSIPLAEVFREYTTTLAGRLAPSPEKPSPEKPSTGKPSLPSGSPSGPA